jgi:L-rhamnose-H+ transport protein
VNSATLYGLSVIALSGILQGSVLSPMKYLRRWPFENIWLLVSTFAYLILPQVFALATIPHLLSTFEHTSAATMERTLLFGLGWGLAVVTFGLGCELLGLAIGYAIILGLGACIGSLVPLIGQHRDQLWRRAGLGTIAGIALLIAGVILFSIAGKKRDELRRGNESGPTKSNDRGGVKPTFVIGLIICIACGVLSPLINIAFAYAKEIQDQAVFFGAAPANSANAVWVLVANAGYLPSLCYCIFLLNRNKSWNRFSWKAEPYWFLTPLMGLMWISGTVLYGMGAIRMGQLGPTIGWPVVMSMMVLTANCWGLLAGEWRGAGGTAIRLATSGLVSIIVAMFVLGWSNNF